MIIHYQQLPLLHSIILKTADHPELVSTVLANCELLHHEVSVSVVVPHAGLLHVELFQKILKPRGGAVREADVLFSSRLRKRLDPTSSPQNPTAAWRGRNTHDLDLHP